MKSPLRILILATALYASALFAQVQVPPEMNYQGQLANADGTPLPTADYTITFRIYDAAQGGTLIWGPQIFDGVGLGHGKKIPVVQGYFNVMLGPSDNSATPRLLSTAFAAGATRYLEIQLGTNTPIAPRQQLLTSPFAFAAGKAAVAETVSPGAIGSSQLASDLILSGNTTINRLTLPSTTLAGAGVINIGAGPFLHNFRGNAFVGDDAGNRTMDGIFNVGIGTHALWRNTSGNSNTALGFESLHNNESGSSNIAIGSKALFANTTGGNNIALGTNAGSNLVAGNHNIDIGNAGVAGDSGTIRIGTQGQQGATYIAGVSGTTIAGGSAVVVNSQGRLGTVSGAPTMQRYTTPGVDSYTPQPNVRWIRIKLVGGGGGGGSSGLQPSEAGSNGQATTFSVRGGAAILTGAGGAGGGGAGTGGGAGGNVAVPRPEVTVIAVAGAAGMTAADINAGLTYQTGGAGAPGPFGGGGGVGGASNSGAGGGGGHSTNPGSSLGAGGGAGGYIEAIIVAPASSYDLFVGDGGAGGRTNIPAGHPGHPGGSGFIIIEEYYF